MANIQPSLSKWLPVALMVGVLAGASVFIIAQVSSSDPTLGWAGAVWVLFISWGAWFAVGARFSRLTKFLIAITGGVVFGWLTLEAYTALLPIIGGTWALPVTVFFVATTIVALELTNMFELAFIYFLSYAGYFAYVFGGFAGEGVSTLQNGIYFWILLMVGVGFGIANVLLKNAVLKIERVPFDQRNTVYDRE